jgi:hypothetical protein
MLDEWTIDANRYRQYLRERRRPDHRDPTPEPQPQPPPNPVGGQPADDTPDLNIPPDALPRAPDIPGGIGQALDIAGFTLSMVTDSTLLALPALEIAGLALSVVQTIIALPLTWLQMDNVNEYNGRIEGYFYGLQSMADQYADRSLDTLPVERLPPVRPPTPRSNREPAYERGLRDGERRAFEYARNYRGTITVPRGGSNVSMEIRGPEYLRLLRRRYTTTVWALFRNHFNRELRRRHGMPWPVMPNQY